MMTRAQSESCLWQRHREGRITVTVVHDIKTLKTDSSDVVLKRVMKYNERDLSKVEAINFGLYNERNAKKLYFSAMKSKHSDFQLRNWGLVIDGACPIFAASPDGVRYCSCHGTGLLEVKCSFKHKDFDVKEIVEIDPTFYLDKKLKLKHSHRYYTQVQFQIYVCQVRLKVKLCLFVLDRPTHNLPPDTKKLYCVFAGEKYKFTCLVIREMLYCGSIHYAGKSQ